MVEAYCSFCDDITLQEVANVLFGALPLGNCSVCHQTNPLGEKLPWVFTRLLGTEFQDYQGKRASFEQRQREH